MDFRALKSLSNQNTLQTHLPFKKTSEIGRDFPKIFRVGMGKIYSRSWIRDLREGGQDFATSLRGSAIHLFLGSYQVVTAEPPTECRSW